MKGRKNGYAFYTEEVKKVNRLVLQGVVFLRILFFKVLGFGSLDCEGIDFNNLF